MYFYFWFIIKLSDIFNSIFFFFWVNVLLLFVIEGVNIFYKGEYIGWIID